MSGISFSATSKAADAPDIEGGIYDARFEGVSIKFVTGGQFGDGDRYDWEFTLFEDGAVLYDEGRDPVVISGLTSLSTNIASKQTPRAVRYLKALMTPVEFAQFEAGEGIPDEALVGRMVQVEVIIKDSGWPSINNVLPAPRKRAKAAPATTIDEE